MARTIRSTGAVRATTAKRNSNRRAGDLDVLLIADEPRTSSRYPFGSRTRSVGAAGMVREAEALDMESVVRRLIELLSQESHP